MSTLLERIGQFRQQWNAGGSLRDRLRAAQDQLQQTQRILIDASTYGNLDHSRNMAIWYARLEITEGASNKELTRAFRRLVRLYHPDLYAADPEYAQLATDLTQQLVIAYRGILEHRGSF